MVWQPNILNNCYELSGGYAFPESPTRGSAPGPRWETSVPQPPCASHQTHCAPHLQILAAPLLSAMLWPRCCWGHSTANVFPKNHFTMMMKGKELNKNIGSKSLHHFVQRLLVPSVRQQVAKPHPDEVRTVQSSRRGGTGQNAQNVCGDLGNW